MAIQTPIQWADSSCNLMMGCDGCELWNPAAGVRHCYAGHDHQRRAGLPGWPKAFDRPEVFLGRLGDALHWRDLRGSERPDKPWLNGLPRLIFCCDEGDPFTESLPPDWLAPALPRLATSPHQWLLLTKRPRRLLAFAAAHPLPENVFLGVSVTNRQTATSRLPALIELRERHPGHVVFLSAEPLLEDAADVLTPDVLAAASWLIAGGESDQGDVKGRPCDLAWLRSLRDMALGRTSFFVKQLGSSPTEGGSPLRLRDGHGGNWYDWPADLRVRQVPVPPHRAALPVQGTLFPAEAG